MIAKISRGSNLFGVLSYNHLKVEQGVAQVLSSHRMMESPDGSSSVVLFQRSFTPYFMANNKTEKPVLHISLNPDPNDSVTDENFIGIANDYIEQLGYGEQPYIVFKHSDIERTHIHIVSVCVDRYGKKIDDSFEKRRSMEICRALEQKFGLQPATDKTKSEQIMFRPVDYKGNDIKSRIASVVRHIPKYYQFQTMGSYNALLSLFNITAETVSGEIMGKQKKGLVYFALNQKGEKAGNPFKASRFGNYAGLDALEKHFDKSKVNMKASPAKDIIKKAVEVAIGISADEDEFKKQLVDQGINTVIRRNENGRIYGVTFIDHESRSVWNGSQLERSLSANTFNELWKGNLAEASQKIEKNISSNMPLSAKENVEEKAETHPLFDFLTKETVNYKQDDFTGFSLLLDLQGEDYEELAFENQMKKKKRKKRPRL